MTIAGIGRTFFLPGRRGSSSSTICDGLAQGIELRSSTALPMSVLVRPRRSFERTIEARPAPQCGHELAPSGTSFPHFAQGSITAAGRIGHFRVGGVVAVLSAG